MMKLYNTLSRQKEEFEPLKDDFVRQYDCGPTVYMYPHIGNLWRYIMSDVLRRTLEYNGFKVRQVMNITDVGHLTDEDLAADTGEDKVEIAARREKKTPVEIAEFYTQAFLKDLDRLNIQRPHVMPKATEHIPEMIALIQRLEEKGFIYSAGNYIVFDISKFSDYGKLSGKNLDELQAGARLEPVEGKKNPFDFALWIVDPKHLMHWDSPWGVGYPGWHIECSAMSMKYLGEQLDIHTGGQDNIFPHHENEIAQSGAATGKPFVKYWLHAGFLTVEGQKMSKSKGNLYRLDDLVERGFEPPAFRYLCLTTHYRKPLNFTWEGLEAAQKALKRLRREAGNWKVEAGNLKVEGNLEAGSSNGTAEESSLQPPASEYHQRFLSAINDDLNLPEALAVVWDLVKAVRANDDSVAAGPWPAVDLLQDFDKVLCLELFSASTQAIPQVIKRLVDEREQHRQKGDYAAADRLRQKILKQGYTIEDASDGPKIRKA
jgi:cysteinyl-tRNA synthetase